MNINGGMMTVKRSPPVLVTPESETPSGSYFLSSLDQAIQFPMQTIYAYRTSSETAAVVLKQSLAKALIHYYPLAGSMALDPEGRLMVECTKKGVPFVEAIADCTIDMLGDLRVPNEDTTAKLIYIDPTAKGYLELPLLSAQVRFYCFSSFMLCYVCISVVHVLFSFLHSCPWTLLSKLKREGSELPMRFCLFIG